MSANQRGALSMCLAMFLYVLNDICIKTLTGHLPPSQIMAVRGVLASLMALAWVVQAREVSGLKSVLKSPLAMARGASESLVALLFITAVTKISLGDATAIMLTTPLLITAISVPLLGEHVGWRRWLAISLGFIGVLFVVKPTGEGLGVWGGLALLCALVTALRDVSTRKISSDFSSRVLMFYSCLSVLMLGAAMYPWQIWVVLTRNDMLIFTLAATLLMFGNYFMAEAFRNVDVSYVSPFRYTVIIWALLASYLTWGHVPDSLSFLGTGLIILSGLYTLYRERIKKKI
jgi:drug/metabolite transporter (DMT)-like permease